MRKVPTRPEFWAALARVEVTDDGCWLWTEQTNAGGYGLIQRDGGTHEEIAHRRAYIEFTHDRRWLPIGMHVDHTCHNRALADGRCDGGKDCAHRRCVNPQHLELVTPLVNRRRALDARRAA